MATKKKSKKHLPNGIAYIKSTFNNSLVTITDENGAVIASVGTGQVGFKGSKKSTPYAAQLASEKAARIAIDSVGMTAVSVIVKGPGSGRETAIRSLQATGLDILSIVQHHDGVTGTAAQYVTFDY